MLPHLWHWCQSRVHCLAGFPSKAIDIDLGQQKHVIVLLFTSFSLKWTTTNRFASFLDQSLSFVCFVDNLWLLASFPISAHFFLYRSSCCCCWWTFICCLYIDSFIVSGLDNLIPIRCLFIFSPMLSVGGIEVCLSIVWPSATAQT